jgi:hypothetical protein
MMETSVRMSVRMAMSVRMTGIMKLQRADVHARKMDARLAR